MPGDLLDIVLIALIAAFAVAGYRQGFIIGVLSLGGFVLGVAGGAFIAPGISRALAKSVQWQAFTAILVVFAAAVIGMLIASGLGVAVRSRLTSRPATVVDSLGGAAVNIAAVLIVAWLIGSFLVNAQFKTISQQVNNSALLRTVDAVMPRGALYLPVFPGLRSLLSNGLYSQVFSAIGAEDSLSLAAPSNAVLKSPGLARDEKSIVKVEGIATSCSQQIEGSGFVVAPQHVLTNAHVVAGVSIGPYVSQQGGAQRLTAHVVLYDPQRDLAVLYVPGLSAPPLNLAGHASNGTSAIVAGYPEDQPLTVGAARIGFSIKASGPNIYSTDEVNREIYPIKAKIRSGNSGGPLLARDGKVYGVVFAASTAYPDIGYALTSGEVTSDVAKGSQATAGVSTERCQDG
ncbi:MAG TPA: MarP family serine protease [Streptosporangiaceae bacterium]|nr:MarP family serine protease [Streptosporangiaceae bacterium]